MHKNIEMNSIVAKQEETQQVIARPDNSEISQPDTCASGLSNLLLVQTMTNKIFQLYIH